MLLDQEAVIVAQEILKVQDFYKNAHKEIYESVCNIALRREPVDLVTLSEDLRNRGILEEVGGILYLTSLSSSVPVAANVKHYAEIVEKKATLRNLIKASEEIIGLAYSTEIDIDEVIEQAEKSIFDLSQNRYREALTPIDKLLSSTFDQIEKLYENKGGIRGLSTGFTDVDRKLNGLNKTDLILVAARPAMGKSAFAMNLAQNIAVRAGGSVAIFSLEMSKEQLMLRMIAAESMVDLTKIQNGNLNEKEWISIANAIAPLSQSNVYFDDTPGISVMEMKSKCRRLKLEKGLDVVLVDYLQLMQGDKRTENRQQEISAISRNLKMLAKELDCPVIALSQLSRAPELRSDRRPILSDLRESGAIEQDADIVMFLYRDEYYHADSEQKNIAEIIVAKHRHGETGTISLIWLGNYQKFLDYEKFREA
ncbi:MAG: replicative DNA helicase [Clostridiales bacterium]|nr:replicative DNA helicase [Clostridiales bacterium]